MPGSSPASGAARLTENTALKRLGERYGLPAPAMEQLRVLARLLSSDPLAPTSVRDPARVVNDHLADSLVALDVLSSVRTAADIGSGAGLPGLPLAIALPDARLALVESARRKCDFISRAVALCRLSNATVVNARAEAWPEGMGRFDAVTARALAPLAVVAEYAAPLLRLGGVLVAWRGRRDPSDEAAAAIACAELGLEVGEIRQVHPYDGAEHRYLHLMSKVMDTPSRFPRRPGMAAKRPLGGPP
jgi:16S rRNA (guanine527-N7)-methyltransferase